MSDRAIPAPRRPASRPPAAPVLARRPARLEGLEPRVLMSTYYVSPTGNDAASGLSTGAAWKTIARANLVDLNAGDQLLFQGGATFKGPAGGGASVVQDAGFDKGLQSWPLTRGSASSSVTAPGNGTLRFGTTVAARGQSLLGRVKAGQGYTLKVRSSVSTTTLGRATAGVDFFLAGKQVGGVQVKLRAAANVTQVRSFVAPRAFDRAEVWVSKDAGNSALTVDLLDVVETATPLTLTAEDAGTAAKPVVVGSYGAGRATIDGGDGVGLYALDAEGVSVKNLNFAGTWQGAAGKGTNAGAGLDFVSTLANNAKHPFVRVESADVKGFKWGGVSFQGLVGKAGYSDVRLTNVAAHDNGDFGIQFVAPLSTSTAAYAFKNIYVDHCAAYNNGGIPDKGIISGNGILLEEVDGGTIERSVAHDNGTKNGSVRAGPSGIWTSNSNAVTIQYNEAYANKSGTIRDGGGFNLDGGVTNSVLQYNYTHDNYGAGLQTAQPTTGAPRPWGHNVIRYNISQNDGRGNAYGGLFMNGGAAMTNVDVYNNTIFTSRAVLNGVAVDNAAVRLVNIGANVRLFNNLILSSGGIPLVDLRGAGTSTVLERNDYCAVDGKFLIRWNANYTTLDAWRTASGREAAGKGLSVNPKLAGTPGAGGMIGNADRLTTLTAYKLAAGSPLFGAGMSAGRRDKVDFYGNPVPAAGNPSIGVAD